MVLPRVSTEKGKTRVINNCQSNSEGWLGFLKVPGVPSALTSDDTQQPALGTWGTLGTLGTLSTLGTLGTWDILA